MTNETVGHYAFHPGSGYQPPKTDKPKAQNPPKSSGVSETPGAEALQELTELLKNNPDGFYTVKTLTTPYPSDIELRIRKEVMDNIKKLDNLVQCPSKPHGYAYQLAQLTTAIKDRLNLLWEE